MRGHFSITLRWASLLLAGSLLWAQTADQSAAMAVAESALAEAVRTSDQGRIAAAWQKLGLVHVRQGQATEALAAYRSGLAAARATTDEKLQAEMLRNIAVAERALGQFTEAIAVDEQSLAISERLGDTRGIIRVLNGLAASSARLGNLRQAGDLFHRCLELGESTGDKTAVSFAIEALGNVYSIQGDAALALEYYEKGLAIRREAGAEPRILANSYVNLIQCYRLNGRDRDALAAAARAIELAREAGDEADAGYAYLNRASVYREQRRYPEALADLRRSLEIYEREKTPLEIAGALASLAQVELDLNHNDAALDDAVRAAGIARGIPAPDILWDALQSAGTAHLRLRQPEQARAAYTEGVDAVDTMRRQLAGGEQNGLDFLRGKMNLFHGLMGIALEAGQTEEALRIAERAKAGLILDVLRAGHATSRTGQSEPLSLRASTALLPDSHTALLEFAVSPEATWLFTIARGADGRPALEVHKLNWKQDDLAREVNAFRRQLESRSLSYRAAAASLYQRLLGPVCEMLRDKTLIAIVPDGPLWNLPFQALIAGDGRHLVEQRALFYTSSLTALLEGRRAPGADAATLLAMGDPELGASHASLGRLPLAAREVTEIGKLYGKGSLTLTGSAASESAWKAQAPSHRVLHLATHGTLNSANPLYSYVMLARGKGEDGLVEAREILDLRLDADLVVLSGCETGRGGFHYGEGLVGLSWAFMVAGSPATMVSQWKVDSESTTRLMVAFHQRLLGAGHAPLTNKAAAWRSAALGLLRDPAFRHPYYWAGFVLIGNGY